MGTFFRGHFWITTILHHSSAPRAAPHVAACAKDGRSSLPKVADETCELATTGPRAARFRAGPLKCRAVSA